MFVTLTIENESHSGRQIVLRADQNMKLGRTELADAAILEDGHLNGLQCALLREGHTCRSRDLNITNTTFVNDAPAIEAELPD